MSPFYENKGQTGSTGCSADSMLASIQKLPLSRHLLQDISEVLAALFTPRGGVFFPGSNLSAEKSTQTAGVPANSASAALEASKR